MNTTDHSLLPFLSFRAISTGILVVLHGGGFVGLTFYRELFLPLTPLLLIAVTALLFSDHEDLRPRFWFFAFGVVGAGMLIELLGVRTGMVFGDYRYTEVLGPAIAGVPILIGVNWLLLIYLTFQASGYLMDHPFLTPLLGACFMLGFDLLLEPVAIEMKFWIWEQGLPPWENYLAWFITAFLFHLVAWNAGLQLRSRVAMPLLFVLVAFFISIVLMA